ncbi:MAG: hypothetical protein II672_07205 [Oscillospiraceae bacterium]|nr:hypothetical protein [Oscillospiraceae bacterium]
MKHAVIVSAEDIGFAGKHIEAESEDGKRIRLAEKEYSAEEMEEYCSQESEWKFCRRGEHMFLADSDSGEDARGTYCGYFDPVPQRAVFADGKLAGFYICSGRIRYSGLSRSSYSMDDWGYPGDDPFEHVSLGNELHLFLFSDKETLRWKDWILLKREAGKEYRSYIDF